MSTPRFQRRVEDFTCEHCGREVKGGGYTNHCPHCLWSKHADVNPGDRADPCLGMMEPISIEGGSPEYIVLHRCVRCGYERKNKVVLGDDREVLIAIAKSRGTRNN